MKKLLSVTLVLVLIMSVSLISVNAETSTDDYGIMPCYLYTNSVSASLSISSKTASCQSVVIGNSSVTKIVITQKLQKKVNGNWTNVKTWTKTVNTTYATYANTKSSLSSGTYRTGTVAKVYKGSSYETVSANSVTKTI